MGLRVVLPCPACVDVPLAEYDCTARAGKLLGLFVRTPRHVEICRALDPCRSSVRTECPEQMGPKVVLQLQVLVHEK